MYFNPAHLVKTAKLLGGIDSFFTLGALFRHDLSTIDHCTALKQCHETLLKIILFVNAFINGVQRLMPFKYPPKVHVLRKFTSPPRFPEMA